MNNKLCDAHLHFNFKTNDPVQDLVNYVDRNNLWKGILILNSSREFELWKKNDSILNERYCPVFGLDKNSCFADSIIPQIKNEGRALRIKVHPRLFNIKESELEWYYSWLLNAKPDVVTIDDFIYGNEVTPEFIISMACDLAKLLQNASIVIAHAGGAKLLEHVMRSKTFKNVYYDISLTSNYLIASSIKTDLSWLIKYHSNRVLIGSDYPDFEFSETKKVIDKICIEEQLDQEQIERIMWKNADQIYVMGQQNGQ